MGLRGLPYLYATLDYGNKPLNSLKWLVAVGVLSVVIHCLVFAVYRVRQCIYVPCCRRRDGVETLPV